jgi:hypothetical protein
MTAPATPQLPPDPGPAGAAASSPAEQRRSAREEKTKAEVAKLVAETKALTSFWGRLFEAVKSIGAVLAAVLAGYAALTTYRVTQLETAQAEAKLAAVKTELKSANDAVVVANKEVATKKAEAVKAESDKKKAQDQLAAIETKLGQDQEKARLAESRLGDVRKQVANNSSIPEPARAAIREGLNGVSATLGSNTKVPDHADVWRAAEKYSKSNDAQAVQQASKILDEAAGHLWEAASGIQAKEMPSFPLSTTGGMFDPTKQRTERWYAFLKPGHGSPTYWIKYEIKIENNFIVFREINDGVVYYKTPISSPTYGEPFVERIKSSMAAQLKDEMNRPD